MEAIIRFKNGNVIVAEKNGSCYITDADPGFPEDLSVVTITDSEGEKVLKNAQVVECASVDKRYWFTFSEMSEEEMWRASIEDALCELSMEE
jgi:hypothetical protein